MGDIAHFVTVLQPQEKAAGTRRREAAPRGTVMMEEQRNALRSVSASTGKFFKIKKQLDNYTARGKDYYKVRMLSLRLCIRICKS